jgi:hypothetical protein
MVNTYVDCETGKTYQEQTTDSETLENGTVVTHSTWILIETPELKSEMKKKVGRPSKNK